MNPWDKGWKPKPLDPSLHSPNQVAASKGEIPKEHPDWWAPQSDAVIACRAEANWQAMLNPDSLVTKKAVAERDEKLRAEGKPARRRDTPPQRVAVKRPTPSSRR